jgi:hypothetical protein
MRVEYLLLFGSSAKQSSRLLFLRLNRPAYQIKSVIICFRVAIDSQTFSKLSENFQEYLSGLFGVLKRARLCFIYSDACTLHPPNQPV